MIRLPTDDVEHVVGEPVRREDPPTDVTAPTSPDPGHAVPVNVRPRTEQEGHDIGDLVGLDQLLDRVRSEDHLVEDGSSGKPCALA